MRKNSTIQNEQKDHAKKTSAQTNQHEIMHFKKLKKLNLF